jgi:hypothetical protein
MIRAREIVGTTEDREIEARKPLVRTQARRNAVSFEAPNFAFVHFLFQQALQ